MMEKNRKISVLRLTIKQQFLQSELGFTLVELAMVLVIIGLIVGGILVGQDLIAAAHVRAQIQQIEKYGSAFNTFRNKYNGIPGDLLYSEASSLGFVTTGCSGGAGKRDGNGLLDGDGVKPLAQFMGETGLFWEDLSSASLINTALPANGVQSINCNLWFTNLTSTAGNLYVGNWIPHGEIFPETFVYVYRINGTHYYGLSGQNTETAGIAEYMRGNPNIPVVLAENIDTKIDDGKPLTGSVNVTYIYGSADTTNASGGPGNGANGVCSNYDANQYLTATHGTKPECALSFKMQ